MNYRKNYIDIINNARKQIRIRKRSDQSGYIYYERHHVLPRSIFPLWEKRKFNIVLLTPREHFICHYLLCKIYEDHPDKSRYYKMAFAFSCMVSLIPDKRYYNSKLYEAIRHNLSSLQAERMKQNNTFALAIEKAKVKVIALETKSIYESVADAARQLGLANGACISDVVNGKKRSAAGLHFQRYSEYLNDEYPKCYLYEELNNLKLGKGMKGKVGELSPFSKKVICLDTSKIYNSIQAAQKTINKGSISLSCRRREKGLFQRAGGFFWSYYDESKSENYWRELLIRSQEFVSNNRSLGAKKRVKDILHIHKMRQYYEA